MRNVTITLDEEVAKWARVEAAKHDTSVSRMLGELLAEKMREENIYQAAMSRFLNRKAYPLRRPGASLPKREELYDRKVLR